jgi:Ser/Thr protein kinase RdoA (MazF antagonist)
MFNFQTRISYQGDAQKLYRQTVLDYDLGEYRSAEDVPIGYEDFNVIITTDNGKFFVKYLASFRTPADCQRYVDTMQRVIATGINHPKLYRSAQGYLHEIALDGATVQMCVLEYVEGKTFYQLHTQPTVDELMYLAQQAALINTIAIKPLAVYDSWACVNFLAELKKSETYLQPMDMVPLRNLAHKFSAYNLDQLPHCFVHGDIIKTNVMRANNGKIYILDFSVSNWYPRVQELAVLFCDLFFNENDPQNFPQLYQQGLVEYQKTVPLSSAEIDILPIYTQVAHAMHLVCATYEREVNGNNTKENDSWLQLGRQGLSYSLQLWG